MKKTVCVVGLALLLANVFGCAGDVRPKAVDGVRVDSDDFTEAVALAESAAMGDLLSSGDFMLVSARRMIIKGKYLWRVTFKASDLIPKDPSKGLIGKGGEIFVNVDLATKKTVVMYGE
ncbi:MAG: hypothetical protein KAJ07_08395 [Planctomycetes bacterium]|nr:hypothetical protein [Planctomycetota bacterium]